MQENTLAVSASGSGQSVIARNKTQLERRLNLEKLAHSYVSILLKDYLQRAIDMVDEL
jgi:hypothetical protein